MTHRTDRHGVTLPPWDFEGSRGLDEHGRRAAALFEAEILLPAQIAGQADSLLMRLPIYRLMIAVLRDAAMVLNLHQRRSTNTARRRVAEIEVWLAREERDHVFSFGAVCDALGLDPRRVRRAIRVWSASPPGKARPRRSYAGFGQHRLGWPRGRRARTPSR